MGHAIWRKVQWVSDDCAVTLQMKLFKNSEAYE